MPVYLIKFDKNKKEISREDLSQKDPRTVEDCINNQDSDTIIEVKE